MKLLVTGAGGMLARAVVREMEERGHEVVAVGRAALDVTDEAAVRERIVQERPEVVVHCAAYTAVDPAESEEALATRVNAVATGHVARACDHVGALLVYPSTDYVFGGDARTPYRPDAPPAPVNAYGRSKLAGERAAREAGRALVVRTSWLYGAGGRNFVDTIRLRAREGGCLQVVADQVGRPTWTEWLAGTTAELIAAGAQGIFHATGGGDPVSWHTFAEQIVAREGLRVRVEPISTPASHRAAVRPAYSVLDCSATEALLARPLPSWDLMLDQYLARTPISA